PCPEQPSASSCSTRRPWTPRSARSPTTACTARSARPEEGEVPRLQVKTFADPDERRTFPLGHAELVHLDESAVGRAHWEPGWGFSTPRAPVAGTASCQVHHLGFCVSGLLRVETDAGETIDIPPDSVYEIPPGHDA